MKIISVSGLFNARLQKYDIPMSEIWDELLDSIHLVDHHKTDLLHMIDSVKDEISKAHPDGGFENGLAEREFWFGFRGDGVDGFDYILGNVYDERRNEIKAEGYWYYRKLFHLTLKTVGDCEIHAELSERDVHQFFHQVKRGGF